MGLFDTLPRGSQLKLWYCDMTTKRVGDAVPDFGLDKYVVLLREGGYVIVDKQQRTNISGVYAAGDITGGLRQVVTACAEGAIAALASTEVLGKQYPY